MNIKELTINAIVEKNKKIGCEWGVYIYMGNETHIKIGQNEENTKKKLKKLKLKINDLFYILHMLHTKNYVEGINMEKLAEFEGTL